MKSRGESPQPSLCENFPQFATLSRVGGNDEVWADRTSEEPVNQKRLNCSLPGYHIPLNQGGIPGGDEEWLTFKGRGVRKQRTPKKNP